ncbi:MAG: hypothetical protein A2Y72_04740 [Chloroflexi bacterium RBG_13_53_26]|nr:MAG: hypothetical protein A2Y72_04740 [Chloroflexi bacterium RBG_13_53_26]
MSNADRTKMGLSNIKGYALLLVVAWSVIVFALLLWNAIQTREETRKYAHIYTNSAFEKDILYRRWATMHGGVYVPVTNKTPPNPYLSDIPERDIRTPSGRQLTLMNPAYMIRQVYEFEREVSGARSHLTSLKTIKPENAPDEWEKKALVAFEQGVTEISSIENIEGREYFRLMRPFITEEGCLKCHAGQGYKVNDIRGGISVSLPLASIRELAGTSQSRNISIYLLLWLVGTGGIVFGYYRVSKSEFKRNQAEKEIESANLDLEKKVQDRTAQLSQVNETLRKERQFLAAVFDSIEEGIVSCDANGVLARFNRATRVFHGLPEEPIPSDQWAQHYDLFLPDGKTPMKKEDVPLFRALQGEKVRNAEMMIIPKQDPARTLVASGQTLKDPEGKIIGAVVAMHDITERKRAEEAMKRNERVLRLFVEHSPAAIAMFDRDMKYIVASRRFLMDYDLGDRNIIGRSHYEVFPEIPERWREIHRRCLAGAVEKSEEDPFPRADGRTDWVRWEIHPWYKTQGEIGGIILFSEVITERKQAEEELRKHRDHLEGLVNERTATLTAKTNELNENQLALMSLVEELNDTTAELAVARDRAEGADKLKSAFLATMSHELRTPLNSIIGFTGIVLQGMSGPLNDEQAKQLGMAKDSANHLLALINDVLDISKIEAGQVEIIRRPFDMRSVIETALRTVLPLAAKKGLSLDSAIASDVGVIISDRRRVEQILINLVGNAVKFTEQGFVRVAARLVRSKEFGARSDEFGVVSALSTQSSALHRDLVEISVADTGIGIKPEDLDKLFKPFSQVDTGLARNHEGTGLGLSICGKLVEMLGGTIRVESEWGKGSKFTFTLPLS